MIVATYEIPGRGVSVTLGFNALMQLLYKRLDYLKRCKIQAFWKLGYTQQKIADEIGVHQSTISRFNGRSIT